MAQPVVAAGERDGERFGAVSGRLEAPPALRPQPGATMGFIVVPCAATMTLSACLLFFVQPMIGKLLLPSLGGAPAVWNTCMLFFQATLLAGYAYVHFGVRWLGVRRHAVVHALLVVIAFASLPPSLPAWDPPTTTSPVLWLAAALAVSVGLPFFVLSSTAPLVQRWFAETRHARAADPYFLYAASNIGSVAGLALYPFVIEPSFGVRTQARGWAVTFVLFAALLTLAALATVRRSRNTQPPSTTADARDADPSVSDDPSAARRGSGPLRWTFLAFVPSALLLTMTTYITTDIAPVPLLWLAPLAIYLVTFVVAFGTNARRLVTAATWIQPLLLLATGAVLILGQHPPWTLSLHIAAFAVTAYAAHAQLARERPAAQRLTAFYLWVSFGGMLGGVFAAIAAPLLLSPKAEYLLLIVLACTARPALAVSSRAFTAVTRAALAAVVLTLVARTLTPGGAWSMLSLLPPALFVLVGLHTLRSRPIGIAIVVSLALAGFEMIVPDHTTVISRERNFFGALTVEEDDEFRLLLHGRTLHGASRIARDSQLEPTTYYQRAGPLGDVFDVTSARTGGSVGVIGLGIGTAACYARPHESWDFYEINPAVTRIARDTSLFHFLADCTPDARFILGDARLKLRQMENARYRLLIVDAFSSDAIPVHLITREAFELYAARLEDDGLIVIHITNRYLDLAPVIASHAASLGFVALLRSDNGRGTNTHSASDWVVLGKPVGDVDRLASRTDWNTLVPDPDMRPWTDDYSNVLSALIVLRRRRAEGG